MHYSAFRLALSLSAALALGACGGAPSGDGGDGGVISEVGVSHTGSRLSHNDSRRGADCMTCHKSGGTGQGVFTVAGTAYNGSSPASSGTVYFYTSNSRTTLITTLEVDAYGNFYTVDPISQLTDTGGGVAGVYVNVDSASMPGLVSNGSCNECHSPDGGVARI